VLLQTVLRRNLQRVEGRNCTDGYDFSDPIHAAGHASRKQTTTHCPESEVKQPLSRVKLGTVAPCSTTSCWICAAVSNAPGSRKFRRQPNRSIVPCTGRHEIERERERDGHGEKGREGKREGEDTPWTSQHWTDRSQHCANRKLRSRLLLSARALGFACAFLFARALLPAWVFGEHASNLFP